MTETGDEWVRVGFLGSFALRKETDRRYWRAVDKSDPSYRHIEWHDNLIIDDFGNLVEVQRWN